MQTDVKLQQVAREEHEDGQCRDGEDEGGVAGEFVAGLGRFDDAHRKPRDEHRERGRRPPAGAAGRGDYEMGSRQSLRDHGLAVFLCLKYIPYLSYLCYNKKCNRLHNEERRRIS
mgnify:CR=1 FL=1